MTQEEKQLLLKDLCARIPYGLKATTKSSCWAGVYDVEGYKNNRIYLDCPVYDEGDDEWLVESVVPYLRPMSSMTKEERAEMGTAIQKDRIEPYGEIKNCGEDNLLLCTIRQSTNLQDWLNKKMFDYRGLIPMGLALETTEEMYN